MNEKLFLEKQVKPHIEFAVTDRLVVFAIIFAALIIRLFMLDSVPDGINQDEAVAAINAKFLMETGRDMNGVRLPVLFQAWDYGQMSIFMSWCMIPFIKIFGFNILAIRMPIAIMSVFGLIALYFSVRKMTGNEKFSQIVLFLGAFNPLHFMDSRWALDCNFFPHMFMIAFCFMLYGLEEKRRLMLYISMVFYGLTFYCYSVSLYIVPFFLLGYFIYLWTKKIVTLRCGLMCAAIYTMIGLPFILCMIINMFGLESIELPFMTIPRFIGNTRYHDIIFFTEDLSGDLFANLLHMLYLYIFGGSSLAISVYFLAVVPLPMLIFLFTGIFKMIEKRGKDGKLGAPYYWALMIWFIVANVSGFITNEVNIQRINIIVYPFIIFVAYGCWYVIERFHKLKYVVISGVLVVTVIAFYNYTTAYAEISRGAFKGDYVDAFEFAKEMDVNDDNIYKIESYQGCPDDPFTYMETYTWTELGVTYDYYKNKSKDSSGHFYKDRYQFLTCQKQDDKFYIDKYNITYDPGIVYIVMTDNHKKSDYPSDYSVKNIGDYDILYAKNDEGTSDL